MVSQMDVPERTAQSTFHGGSACLLAACPRLFCSWRMACVLPCLQFSCTPPWRHWPRLACLITSTSKQVITFFSCELWLGLQTDHFVPLYSFTFIFLPCGVCWPSDCISANNIMHSTAWSTNWRRNSAAHAVTFSPFVQTWGKRYKYNNDAGKQLIWVWTLKSEPAWSSEKLVANGLSGLLITWMAAKFKTKRVFTSWKFLNLATVALSFLFDS